jgi:transposase
LLIPKDGRALRSNQTLRCSQIKDDEGKKSKQIREESFSSKLFFQKNSFSYIDKIVDPGRKTRSGPKGYLPSSIFMALLLMYLKSMESILELVRFLNSNPDWLVALNLKKVKSQYKVPHRTTFYKFAVRLGPDKIVEIFSIMVVALIKKGVITGEKISLDCSIIWAWFKDCKFANSPRHNDRKCRRHKSRDKHASWEWDHHRERYVFGYKIHIAIDSLSGLPIMLTVTKAGYGENRTVRWFVKMLTLKLSPPLSVKKFLADGAYDGYKTRLALIRKLKAVPFIALNPRNCNGDTKEEKMEQCKKKRYKWYCKNFFKSFWVDPNSEEFDREFDARTFSEQGFSVGKGSLNLDSLKHKGKSWTALHAACICMVMLGVAKTANEIGRADLARCVKCFQA